MKQGRLYVNSLLTLATKVTFIVLYSLLKSITEIQKVYISISIISIMGSQ